MKFIVVVTWAYYDEPNDINDVTFAVEADTVEDARRRAVDLLGDWDWLKHVLKDEAEPWNVGIEHIVCLSRADFDAVPTYDLSTFKVMNS